MRKYCEELGLDSVETRLVLEKIEEVQRKGNKLGNQGQQRADKPWYERALDTIVDGWNFVTNWVSNNWGLILTGLSVVATVAGLIALGVATGGTGLAALGLVGMSTETALAALSFAAISGIISTILQAVKSLFNQPMNQWDFAVNVGNMIIAYGVQIGYAIVQVGISYGVYTSGGGASPDPIPGDKGTGNPHYSGNRDTGADFRNGSSLDKHFGDHGADFGSQTSQGYLNNARDFFDNPPSGAESFTSNGGTYFQYDASTNTFGIINEYGGISTYFKPDTGINYWLDQISKYKP